MPKVVYYQDASEDRLWRFRVIADNNEIVHASHKGWSSCDDARVSLLLLRHELDGHINHFEALRDRSGTGGGCLATKTSSLEVANWNAHDQWRWKFIAVGSGVLIGKSHESFQKIEGCVHNLQLLRAILISDHNEDTVPHG